MQVANTTKSKAVEKGVFKAVFLVFAWLIIISLAKDAFNMRRGFERVAESNTRLSLEEARNADLKRKYEAVRTDEYRERLIREQLNMQKEGEVIAVLPKTNLSNSVPNTEKVENLENWEKWISLIY